MLKCQCTAALVVIAVVDVAVVTEVGAAATRAVLTAAIAQCSM